MHLFQTTPIHAFASCPLDTGTMILIVLVAALLLAAYRLCGIMAEINKTLAKPSHSATQVSAPAEVKTASAEAKAAAPAAHADGLTPEIIAAISAAIISVVGKSHRIISIKPMSSSWERAGRQSVLTSHRIR